MADRTKCVAGTEHRPEYHSTQEGRTYYVCWLCGNVEFQFEENNGG